VPHSLQERIMPSDEEGIAFCEKAEHALENQDFRFISDHVLRRVLTVAVKTYVMKVEKGGSAIEPFESNKVTATESVVAVCAMIRAVDLNMFDVALWFNRPT